jgi:putative ABC transport system permease protein
MASREPLWRRYLRFFGADPRADVDDEIRFHLEELERQFKEQGMTPAAAARAARDQFGDVEQVGRTLTRTSVRHHRWLRRMAWWRGFAGQLGLAARRTVQQPAFAAAAVLTLGLGMGAATSIYTLVERVVLDPLPYPHSDRLVRLNNPVPAVGPDATFDLSTAQYFYYLRHDRSLSAIGLFVQGSGILDDANGSAAEHIREAAVTASMLGLLGARAERGRLIDTADDAPGAPAVALLSDGFWRQRYGGSDAVIGRTASVDGRRLQIVGVLAPGLRLPPEPGEAPSAGAEVWLPRQLDPAGPFYNDHSNPAIARLAPGVTLQEAQRELDRLTAQLPQAYPNVYYAGFFKQTRFRTSVVPLKTYVVGRAARYLWMLLAAVGLVLLIACANVVNLILVRVEARAHDVAIRTALGASWSDLAREAFVEGLALSLTGATLGLLLTLAGVHWLTSLAPAGLPRLGNVHLDAGVFVFALTLGLGTAIVLAAAPVVRARSASTLVLLGEGSRRMTTGPRGRRLRDGLVVLQVALASLLVVGSGLLLRSYTRLRAVNPGIDPKGVLTVEMYLPQQRYDSLYKAWGFYARLLSEVRALPGVEAAGLSQWIPLGGHEGCTLEGFEDRTVYQHMRETNDNGCAVQTSTSPGYFAAMHIPLIHGRLFTGADNDAPRRGAVVVSESFARRFWPNENPIGKGVGPNGSTTPPFYHVVGVVGDVAESSLDGPPAAAIYYPVVPVTEGFHWYVNGMTLAVRTAQGDPASYVPAIRRLATGLDPGVALANAQDMTTVVARSMSQLTFSMTLLGIAGVTALLLAAVGLYGVISYLVACRTNEIGVRLALGARPAQLQRLVVGSTLGLTFAGLAVGCVAALVSGQVLAGLLYGVTGWDPATYAAAALILAAVALMAGWIPARRAARVDPSVALRAE